MKISLKILYSIMIVGCVMTQWSSASTEEKKNSVLLDSAISFWRTLENASPPTARATSSPSMGETVFLPVTNLIRGQDEVSIDNISAKLKDRTESGDVSFDASSRTWSLKHDEGRSSAPIDDPIRVVKGPQGFVIIDGHHDLYLALSVGARTAPVRVVEDLSKFSALEFWEEMKSRQLVYLNRSAAELAERPPRMDDVRDNPNRYLASLLAMKTAIRIEGRNLFVEEVKGAANPVWIKIGDSIPFIEFHIAKILTEAGIRYEGNWGGNVPDSVIEASRKALVRAKEEDRLDALESVPVLVSTEEATEARNDRSKLLLKVSLSIGNVPQSCETLFSR